MRRARERVAHGLCGKRLRGDIAKYLNDLDFVFLEPFVHVVLDGGGVVFEAFEDFDLMHKGSPVDG